MTQLLSRVALALAMTFAAGSAGTVFAQTDQGQTGTPPAAATSDPAQEVCAVDWATADANSDGQIAEDEASEELKGQFAMVDTDSSGSISQEEYEACGKT
jgi:hypothetical protein